MKTPKTIDLLNEITYATERLTADSEQLAYALRWGEPIEDYEIQEFHKQCEKLTRLLAKHYRCNFSRVDA